jgi:hypothetical protein
MVDISKMLISIMNCKAELGLSVSGGNWKKAFITLDSMLPWLNVK